MYRAIYGRHALDVEMCTLRHAGPLPPPWMAPGFVLNLVVGGAADLSVRGRTHLTTVDNVVLVEPGDVRRVLRRHSSDAVTRSLTFTEGRFRDEMCERGLQDARFDRNVAAPGRLSRALRAFHRAVDAAEESLAVETALDHVLDVLARDVGSPRAWRPDNLGVLRAREWLHAHYDEPVRGRDLSAHVGITRSHLTRMFTRALGVSPHEYLVQLRVARARELLRRGGLPGEVSAEVGFCDQSHMNRHFRRLLGVTPGQYRRLVR